MPTKVITIDQKTKDWSIEVVKQTMGGMPLDMQAAAIELLIEGRIKAERCTRCLKWIIYKPEIGLKHCNQCGWRKK